MILTKSLLTYHITQLRQSPATGIFLTCGWVAGVLLAFIPGQLVAANRADLSSLFTYLPWVMAILIPTLTMPVATESRRGVTERLLTLPHTPTQRLFSRFTVYWALLGLWLFGFWPLVATLYYLGNPEFGPIATGLLGAWMLSAPMLALNLALCLRAKSGVGGLLSSLAANLILLLLGTAMVTGWLASVPGLGWLPSIRTFTLLGALAPFTEGLLNLAAILLLTGLAVFILGIATGRRAGIPAAAIGAAMLICSLVPTYWQIDTTTDALHTPSPATVQALRSLPSPVTFTLYLSQNNPDIPATVHATTHRLTSLLLRLRAESPGTVTVRMANTDASIPAAIAALQAGAEEQSLPTGTTYFAALTATVASTTHVIPALNPARQPVMEYDVMTLLAQTARHTAPVVAVMSESAPAWQPTLAQAFTFANVAPSTGITEIPSATAVLVLPTDAPLPEATITAIRTYMASGGNVVLMADSFSRTNQPTSSFGADQPLSTILPEFGLTIASQTVIADPTQATLAEQDRAGAMAYPYWLQLNATNLDASLPFTSGISKLYVPEAAEILTDTSATTISISPILTTSPNARAVPLNIFQETSPELAMATLPAATPQTTGPHILAAMASGALGQGATRTGNLVMFADSDWLTPAALAQAPDNLTLFTGLLHYLSGQQVLTQLRAKGATPRTLTRIESLASRLTLATANTERDIATRLHDVTTSPDDEASAQEEAFTLRQQLRDIRAETRHRLQMLENALLLINLALMPTIVGALFFWQRRRQRRLAASAS